MNTVAKLLKLLFILSVPVFNYAQVRLQTGTPDISFPLYQFNDVKNGLSTGISLIYVGGNGIKVNDIASSVGTGWDLLAGGVIVRIQNGEPDDQKYDQPSGITGDPTDKIVYSPPLNDYYPNGYLYATISPQTVIPGNGAFYPMMTSQGISSKYKPNFADREQDIFIFQFNGRTGRFVVGKDLSVLLMEDSKLKVEFTRTDMSAQNIRTRISDFSITDENGTKYIFSERELTENVIYENGYGGFNGGTFGQVGQTMYSTLPVKKVDKWFLKEIVHPFTNKKIVFNYDSYSLNFEGPRTVSHQTSSQENAPSRITKMIQRIKSDTKRLNNIEMPDGQKLNFVYSTSNRVDLNGDKYLERIDILYNNIYKYGYKFNFGYFLKKEIKATNYNFSAGEIRFARLCLLSFAKRVNDYALDNPHSFEYNLTDDANPENMEYQGVPARFTYRSDYWGYYNAASGVEDTYGNPLYSTSSSISNTKHPHPSAAKIGLIKKITYPTGGYLEYKYDANRSINSGYFANSTGGIAAGVRVSLTTVFDGISHIKNIVKEYKYNNEAGTASSLWGFEMPVASQTKNIRIYKSSTQLWGATYSKESGSIHVSNVGYTAYNFGMFLYALYTNPYSAILGLVATVLWQAFAPDYQDYTTTTIFSESLLNKNPLPTLYNRVEVIEKNGGSTNGKTVYTFTDNVLYPIAGSYAFPYSIKSRYASWLYGLPKTVEWLNASGVRIKKTENFYNAVTRNVNEARYVSRAWDANRVLMAKYDRQNEFITSTEMITSDIYYPLTGRIELTQTDETVYNPSGQNVVITTKYTYTENYQVRSIEKYSSGNRSTGVINHYPQDYGTTGIAPFITTMKNRNIYSLPIISVSWLKDNAASGPRKTTKALLTLYDNTPNGNLHPSEIYSYNLLNTVDELYTTSRPSLDPNVSNYLRNWEQDASFIYDTYGNLVQTNTKGKYQSKIFDYNGRIPIAEISNAAFDQVAYTSFESNGKGNWTFTGTPVDNPAAITGKKSYNLSSGAISKTVTAASAYTLSYWRPASDPALTITGTQSGYPVVSQTINNWKLYEHKITGISTITISGSGSVDELRLYPWNAVMSTGTYDPVFGITAKCDADNSITYYEYDDFGRLMLVKDQNKNILKKLCYNSTGQSAGCPPFLNNARSGIFTRTCTGCLVAPSVTYTVPAGTYTSNASQADADQKAIAAVNSNGPAYAIANSTCATPSNIGVNSINQTSESITVVFTNTCTHHNYSYTINAGSSPSLGPIPAGTYDVYAYLPTSGSITFMINGYSQTGNTAVSFFNIPMQGTGMIQITY
ncbi:MAG: DUF5977 domain-containing protein [Agriterribacter sp.]